MQEILPLNSSSYHAHIYIFFFRLAGKYGCRCTDNANTAEPAPQPSPPDFPLSQENLLAKKKSKENPAAAQGW